MLEELTDHLRGIRGSIEQRRRNAAESLAYRQNPCGEITLSTLGNCSLRVGDTIVVRDSSGMNHHATVKEIIRHNRNGHQLDYSTLELRLLQHFQNTVTGRTPSQSPTGHMSMSGIAQPIQHEVIRHRTYGNYSGSRRGAGVPKDFKPPWPTPKPMKSQINARGPSRRR